MNRLASIVVAAAAFAVIAQFIHTVGAFLAMDYYSDPAYACVWSRVMMPVGGPPPAGFFILAIGISFVTGVIYAVAYNMIKAVLPGDSPVKRGLCFGVFLFLISGLPGNVSNFLLINLPFALAGMWTIETLVVSLVGGAVLGSLLK